MPSRHRIAIVSDVHYAGPSERQRGNDYEYRDLPGWRQRNFCRLYRHLFWLRHPLDHSDLLDQCLARLPAVDHVFALGDYSCDSAFVGLSDDAALESATLCLDKLRARFGSRLHALIGDHELGKFPMMGQRGGLRWRSWRRALDSLGLKPCWRVDIGQTSCVGVTSSLLMLPAYTAEMLPEEAPAWQEARRAHLDEVRAVFASIDDSRRILLFCHDPSALPYLLEEPAVRSRLSLIQQTFIGHLHSPLIFWQSRLLAGMPRITFLGHTVKRLSQALARARAWRPFKVRLCPSLAGIELLKDGGFYLAELSDAPEPVFLPSRQRLPR